MTSFPRIASAVFTGDPDSPDPWEADALWAPGESWLEVYVDRGGGEAAQMQLAVASVRGEAASVGSGGVTLGWPRVFVGGQRRGVTGRLLARAVEACADADEARATGALATIGMFERDPLLFAPEAHTRRERRRRGDRPRPTVQLLSEAPGLQDTRLLSFSVSDGRGAASELTLCAVTHEHLRNWLEDAEVALVGSGLLVLSEQTPRAIEERLAEQLTPYAWHLPSAAERLTAAAERAPCLLT